MSEKIQYMLCGVIVLLLVKYVVFGLNNWDAIFHPERTEAPDSVFLKPFLGAFACQN
jgi:hypothetical protein